MLLGPRRCLLPALVAAWIGVAAAAPPAGFRDVTLDNGLEVSILADPSMPVVATQVWYRVGAANEEEGSRGLAHLFEHLMFGANDRYGPEDYSRWHTVHGGTENAYTTFDETVYHSAIEPPFHEHVLEMEAARMRGLILAPEALANEQRIVTEELRLRVENDPLARAARIGLAAILGGHPYAVLPTGTKEDVAAATVESCRAFYDRWYGPRNAHLVIVGPVDPEATLAEVRETFGRIPATGEVPRDVPALVDWGYPDGAPTVREDLPPVETAIVAFPLPPPADGDFWALAVLEQLLAGGEVDRFADDIVRRRDKALVAGTMPVPFRRGGALVFWAAELPYRRKATAFRQVDRTLGRLSRLDWLTDDAVDAARRTLLVRRAEGAFRADAVATRIGQAAWWRGDALLAFDGDEGIRGVTRERVVEAWRRWIADAEPVRLYLVPERVPLAVRLFGWAARPFL